MMANFPFFHHAVIQMLSGAAMLPASKMNNLLPPPPRNRGETCSVVLANEMQVQISGKVWLF